MKREKKQTKKTKKTKKKPRQTILDKTDSIYGT